MRIISQNKMKDVPYERIMLYVEETCIGRREFMIIASFGLNEKEDHILGSYSTIERCSEIMQKIRDTAQGTINIQGVSDEDINLLKRELHNVSIIQSAQNESKIQICGETYFYMPEE